ncbi:hypothetical protein V8F06_012266 [Rhypophila decipiens]
MMKRGDLVTPIQQMLWSLVGCTKHSLLQISFNLPLANIFIWISLRIARFKVSTWPILSFSLFLWFSVQTALLHPGSFLHFSSNYLNTYPVQGEFLVRASI